MRVFVKALDLIEVLANSAGVLVIAAIAVVTFVFVIYRYIPQLPPLGWGVELCSLLCLGAVFFGVATVTRRNRHIKMTFFAEFLFKQRAPSFMAAAENITGLGICVLLSVLGYRFVHSSYLMGTNAYGALKYPLWVPQTMLLVGPALMVIFYLERLIRQILRLPPLNGAQQSALSADEEVAGTTEEPKMTGKDDSQ